MKRDGAWQERYVDMIRRHLGRGPKRGDGVTQASLRACERCLGIRLPESMRAYYLLAGRLEALNSAHNLLFKLDELKVDQSHLWFMEENQAVVHWGLRVKHLVQPDPMVYQRENAEGAKWYSERLRFSYFLVRMYDWQAGFADPPHGST